MPSTDPVFHHETAAARIAQREWARETVGRRFALFARLRERLVAEAETLAALACGADAGPDRIAQALTSEVIPLADACRYLEREGANVLARRRLGRRGRAIWLQGVRSEVAREPHGVVLVIAPGNYRLLLAGVQLLQALAAGNAVLLKPAPGKGAALDRLIALAIEAGLDARLVQRLPDDDASGAAALEAAVDHVVFTGHVDTGRSLLATLAPRLIPAVVELSGRDAVFVMSDADIELAADCIAWGATFNAGATCIAPRRVFVDRQRAAALETALVERLEKTPPLSVDARVAASARAAIDEALAGGARCVLPRGGLSAATPAALPAVLLADVPGAARVMQEDLFAPILAMVAVADMDEALALDAACAYRLGASVFGEAAAARRLADRIDTGVVTVNDLIAPTADARLPFGGRGASGYGLTRGREGLLSMTRAKVVILRSGRRRPHVWAPRAGDLALFAAFARLAHGRGLIARGRALLELLRAGARRGL